MTPILLNKIKELVAAGATILGKPPRKSPSLTDYPACDGKVEQLAKELWGDCDGVKEMTFGKGKVLCGLTPEEAMAGMQVPPDFRCSGREINYIHRRTGDTDLYFLANGTKNAVTRTSIFRIDSKQPEIWHPDTGQIEIPAMYRNADGCTYVPIHFEAEGSVFVVFRRPRMTDPVVSISREGKILAEVAHPKAQIVGKLPANGKTQVKVNPSAKTVDDTSFLNAVAGTGGEVSLSTSEAGKYTLITMAGRVCQVEVGTVPSPMAVPGPWTVRFAKGWGAPDEIRMEKLTSWHEHPDPGVIYFSGTATYATTFTMAADLRQTSRRLLLDLGKVAVIADVKLNGKHLGILWKPPFQIDATDAIKDGDNALEVAVVNVWVNRIIGDLQLPVDVFAQDKPPEWYTQGGAPSPNGRSTCFVGRTKPKYTKDDPLQESGLLGPVRIMTVRSVPVERNKP